MNMGDRSSGPTNALPSALIPVKTHRMASVAYATPFRERGNTAKMANATPAHTVNASSVEMISSAI